MNNPELNTVEEYPVSQRHWEFIPWRIRDIFYALLATLFCLLLYAVILYEILHLEEGITFAIFFILMLITAAYFAWIFGIVKYNGKISDLGLSFTALKYQMMRGLKWLPVTMATDILGVILIVIFVAIYAAATKEPFRKTLNRLWLEEKKTPDASDIEKPFKEAPGTYFWAFSILVVCAPICEEIFFRGFIYGALRRRWRKIPSQIISAGLFGICHGPLCFMQFFFGFITAHLYESNKPRSLLPSISLHMLHNTIVFLLLVVCYNI